MLSISRNLALPVALILLRLSAEGAQTETRLYSSVMLSEICCYPVAGENPWIEIVNWGSNAVSMTGWCLSDSAGSTFTIPKEMPAIPPEGAVVVVVSSQPGSQKPDLSFEGDGVVTLIWNRPETLPVYPDVTKGVCALYTNDSCAKEAAVDAICWGYREHRRASEHPEPISAFEYPESISEVWPKHYLISTPTLEEHGTIAGGRVMTKGGSLVRVAFPKSRGAGWFICPPKYVSRGRKNRWLPPSINNHGGFTGAELLVTFNWRYYGGGAGPYSRIQISQSAKFDDMVMDAKVTFEGMICIPKLTFAGVHFYWRVRGEGDGVQGIWSEVREFQVESIETIEKMMSPYAAKTPP